MELYGKFHNESKISTKIIGSIFFALKLKYNHLMHINISTIIILSLNFPPERAVRLFFTLS
jgi:hypothetical protein